MLKQGYIRARFNIVIIGLGALFLFTNCFSCKSKQPNSTKKTVHELIRNCPDEWIINAMPGVGSTAKSKEYYIYQGKRRELSEFDTEWVKKNCKDLKAQTVH